MSLIGSLLAMLIVSLLYIDKNTDFTYMSYLKMCLRMGFSHCFTTDSYIPMCILPQNTPG